MPPLLILAVLILGVLLASEIMDAIDDLLRRVATLGMFCLVIGWLYASGAFA